MPITSATVRQTKEVEEKEESLPTNSSLSIVAYNGRKVDFDLNLRSLSVTDKILFGLHYAVDMPVPHCTMMDSLPDGIKKIFHQVNLMMETITQSSIQSVIQRGHLSAMDRLQIEIKNEIDQENEQEKYQLILHDQIGNLLTHLSQRRRQEFLLAGVSSQKEFEEKQAKITSYKSSAEKQYLHDKQNILIRQQIDEKLISAQKGELNHQDQCMIQHYWDSVLTAEDVYEKMKRVESRIRGIYVEFLFNYTNSCADFSSKMIEQGIDVKDAGVREFVSLLQGSVKEVEENLKIERIQCLTPDAQLELDYILLKGHCIMTPLVNEFTRQYVINQANKLDKKTEPFTTLFKNFSLKTIERCQKSLVEQQDIIHKSELALQELDLKGEENEDIELNKEFLREDIDYAKKRMEIDQKQIRKEQSKTSQNFKKEAYRFLKMEDPQKLFSYFPEKTEGEQQLLQIMAIEEGLNIERLMTQPQNQEVEVSADLQLDLNQLQNPVDYFVEKFREQDMQKLGVLQSRFQEL